MTAVLPTDSTDRKNIPLMAGCVDYFPAALAEVARVSKAGNDQHNPGKPLHWARGKSTDHADCIIRHLVDRGRRDTDGQRHSAKVAWRALAMLQEELEAEGAAPGRASKFPEPKPEGLAVETPAWDSRAPGVMPPCAHPATYRMPGSKVTRCCLCNFALTTEGCVL